MAPQKESIMVLKVDLDCPRCYKKVKKLLFQFPQIKDQIYNEKQNTVTIRVLCCSPDKIRDQLCYKGRKSIKTIEILEPKKKPDPVPARNPKPEPALKSADPNPPESEPPRMPAEAALVPIPVQKWEPVQCYPVYPMNVCCTECYEGRTTGPCYQGLGYGHGVAPAPAGGCCCYDDGVAPPPPPPVYGYNYKPGYCLNRCGDYINDENPTSCVVM